MNDVKRISTRVLLAGLLLVSGGQLFAVPMQTPKNKEEAMKLIDTVDAVMGKNHNLYLRIGDDKEIEKMWTMLFKHIEVYIEKNTGTKLLYKFRELRAISMNTFDYLSRTYAQFIAPHIVMQADKAKGIVATDRDTISRRVKLNGTILDQMYRQAIQPFQREVGMDDTPLPGSKIHPGSKVIFGSKKINEIIESLDIIRKEYRSERFTSYKKGDAVEVLIFLAKRINDHIIRCIKTDYMFLNEMVKTYW
ncbi:MAG TPA: hypothetical protein VGT41_02320 [Candidatus Babeliales bacterium]|nr:hypothetical protein [Candidatus Babeliales bacterium]